jgi:hypothetical protein
MLRYLSMEDETGGCGCMKGHFGLRETETQSTRASCSLQLVKVEVRKHRLPEVVLMAR